ncbi:hypothetical protein E3P86_03058 [Wallemia ichthyophaga]|uniref:Uncharacterized protein n=1 Tax=Wallemia ichthyophaga TaxID=245174 RepID=A0A4T0ISA7_WALIC|nr:hypothetical protein E3P86_03058 [Wallemia ichthyophaga]
MSIGLAHVAYSAIARDSDVDPPTMHNDGQLMPSSSSTSLLATPDYPTYSDGKRTSSSLPIERSIGLTNI